MSADVSVVMPVYNALPHLDAAVRSILDQSFRDFEFVIYDDASTDGSTERLRYWAGQDRRIHLIEGQRNLGPVGSSALVVERSTAPLVARMDADDLCSPERLERQLDVLGGHPKAGVVGTMFEIIDAEGQRIRGLELWRLARKSPIVPFAAHGSIMFRRSVFEEVGGYRPECEFWEDQDLIIRMASVTEVLVIPEPLYQGRQWVSKSHAGTDPERVENAVDLMYRAMARLERGRRYDDLLTTRCPPDGKVDPRVFIAAGSRTLWSGARPRLFRRLLKRGRINFDVRSVTALVWTAWAALSPSSLRASLRLLLKLRNLRAGEVRLDGAPLRWKPAIGSAPEE
jgi:glycosyltransferase involved in cell wall biosynthesis